MHISSSVIIFPTRAGSLSYMSIFMSPKPMTMVLWGGKMYWAESNASFWDRVELRHMYTSSVNNVSLFWTSIGILSTPSGGKSSDAIWRNLRTVAFILL